MDDRNRSTWPEASFRCMDLGDIVQIMTTIIQDDGPMPMRDKKPAERLKNAADLFKEAYQADYESRFPKSRDGIERVHNHNTAYPKLRDELDRKRSLTKATLPNMSNKPDGAHSVSNFGIRCKELKRKKSRPKRKYERKPKIRYESRVRTKTINKQRNRKNNPELNRCLCQGFIKTKKKDMESRRAKPKVARKRNNHRFEMDLDVDSNVYLRNLKKVDSKQDIGTKDPDTSGISISTYGSYPSSNHEPQV